MKMTALPLLLRWTVLLLLLALCLGQLCELVHDLLPSQQHRSNSSR
jgi:hypothetical protein